MSKHQLRIEKKTYIESSLYGGTALPTPKLACFVLYLKIINIFLKSNICIL